MLGGRTNHYGRVTLRMADYDFKPKSTDGLGFDWPIGYADMAPYYDKAERFIGVTGTPEGIRSAPDGIFNPPAPLPRARRRSIQRVLREARHPRGRRASGGHDRGAQRPAGVPLLRPVRPRLHDGLELRRQLRADFPGDGDRAASRSLANAMARELITDDTGKVTAVSYIDKTTAPRSRCAAAPSCLRPARASRRGCC